MKIFISHAVANAQLAKVLSEAIESAPEVPTTFLASRAGDIRADENWLSVIEREIQASDVFIILLTPESILRPWVNFEVGAAWFSGKSLVLTRTTNLLINEIPLPIASRQIYCLDNQTELSAIFGVLNVTLQNPEQWVERIKSVKIDSTTNEGTWEGVEIDGQFYGWAGPQLGGLKDLESTPPPQGLLEEIRHRGMTPRWVNDDKLAHHTLKGGAQVFATDRTTWRRVIRDRKTVLFIGSS